MEITERDETLGISRQIVTFLHIYIYKWMELKSVKCLRIVLFYYFFF